MPFQDWIGDAQRIPQVDPTPFVTAGSRVILDAASPGGIPVHSGSVLVAGYYTGTPGLFWEGHPMNVSIDQAGSSVTGRDRDTCIVKDVEPGAYRPAAIPGFTFVNVERPTVYCDRMDLPAVLSEWKRDIWLAWPGWNGEPVHSQVIAVQNNFAGSFDSSVILDPSWPNAIGTPPATPNPQPGWHFCHRCGGLIHMPEAAQLPCAAGGVHGPSDSHNYSLDWG